MFVRVLIALAILVAAIMLVKRARAAVGSRERPRAIDAKMTKCARCGVYFPRGDAVRRDGADFCSEAHAAEGADR